MRYTKKCKKKISKKSKFNKKKYTKKRFLQKGGITKEEIGGKVLKRLYEKIKIYGITESTFLKIADGRITTNNPRFFEVQERQTLNTIDKYLELIVYINRIVAILKNTINVISNMREIDKIREIPIIYDHEFKNIDINNIDIDYKERTNRRINSLLDLLLKYDNSYDEIIDKREYTRIQKIQRENYFFGGKTTYLMEDGKILDLFRTDIYGNIKGSVPFIALIPNLEKSTPFVKKVSLPIEKDEEEEKEEKEEEEKEALARSLNITVEYSDPIILETPKIIHTLVFRGKVVNYETFIKPYGWTSKTIIQYGKKGELTKTDKTTFTHMVTTMKEVDFFAVSEYVPFTESVTSSLIFLNIKNRNITEHANTNENIFKVEISNNAPVGYEEYSINEHNKSKYNKTTLEPNELFKYNFETASKIILPGSKKFEYTINFKINDASKCKSQPINFDLLYERSRNNLKFENFEKIFKK